MDGGTCRRRRLIGAVALFALLAAAQAAIARPQDAVPDDGEETSMERIEAEARGDFEVKLAPLDTYGAAEDSGLGRMSIDKTFTGDLAATSRGEMLSARTAVEGSAAYVALERVAGRLGGREGTFVLQHRGTMDRGEPSLRVTVVPDSGTGGLEGLQGEMDILIEDGHHSYVLRYSLPVEE